MSYVAKFSLAFTLPPAEGSRYGVDEEAASISLRGHTPEELLDAMARHIDALKVQATTKYDPVTFLTTPLRDAEPS